MQLLTTLSADADFVDFSASGGQVVASYPTYGEAQQAIDRLADASFPVQYSEIVGRDVRLVERVTGRMSDGRAAAFGFLAHRMGSGRHDFASLRSLAASRYDVTIADAHADRASQLLSPLA
jgi:hypothetical protein